MDNTLDFLDSVGAAANRRSALHISQDKARKKKEIGLVRWRIAFSASSRSALFPDVALQIEGIRIDNGESWTSSEVLDVDLPNTIHTANTIYQLVGKIDARVCLEKGMPHEFIDKFTNGFPHDWKEGINEFINFLFQHAGRQRTSNFGKENEQPDDPTIDFASNDNFSPDSPNRIADFNSETSSIYPQQSPSFLPTIASLSPQKTPSPTKQKRISFANVTVRRTNRKSIIPEEVFTPPILNRSKRGRVIKPRLAPGQRIIYDCYGSPIEARKDATRTHITNNSSIEFESVWKALNLEKPNSPTQVERRLSNIVDKKARRRTIAQRRKTLAKMLAYDKSEDNEEMDRKYLEALEELTFDGIDLDATILSPIVLKKPNARRFIDSDDDIEIEEEAPKIVKPSKSKSPKAKKIKPVKVKEPKSRSARSTKVKPVKEKAVKEKPVKERPAKAKSKKIREVEPKTPIAKSPTPSILPTPSPLKPISTPAKPKRKIWGAKDKRDLEAAFFAYNPCNDKDWERVREALPVEWSIEEIKAQANKMKLKPLALIDKNRTPKTTAIEKIRQLMPDGKLPQKGTIRREALEEEVLQQLFVKRVENEDQLGSSLDDSDDMLVREAMQSHALENLHATETNNKFATPSKRAFFPKAVSACRRRSSIAAINSVGDDFSIPDRGKMKYRLKFRAQQFNRRHGMNAIKEHNDNEFMENSGELQNANDSLDESFA